MNETQTRDKEYYDRFRTHAPVGWRHIADNLIDICERDGTEILQIKEKYGELRFYYGRPYSDELRNAVEEAEYESQRTCQACGGWGSTHQGKTGWISTLCETCAKDLKHHQFSW